MGRLIKIHSPAQTFLSALTKLPYPIVNMKCNHAGRNIFSVKGAAVPMCSQLSFFFNMQVQITNKGRIMFSEFRTETCMEIIAAVELMY